MDACCASTSSSAAASAQNAWSALPRNDERVASTESVAARALWPAASIDAQLDGTTRGTRSETDPESESSGWSVVTPGAFETSWPTDARKSNSAERSSVTSWLLRV